MIRAGSTGASEALREPVQADKTGEMTRASSESTAAPGTTASSVGKNVDECAVDRFAEVGGRIVAVHHQLVPGGRVEA